MDKNEIEENAKKAQKGIKNTLEEFKKFLNQGNVVDMAVGVIIGSAFGKIVSSLVDDILMPIIGAIIGGLDFSALSITIGEAKILYGNFIQNIIDFLIIAACIFVMVKLLNKLQGKHKEEPKKAEPTVEDKQLETLEQIKTLLEKK